MSDWLPNPAEVEIAGTYYPPILVSAILGILAMVFTTKWLARRRLFRFVYYPNVVMLAMTILYTLLIGTILVPA